MSASDLGTETDTNQNQQLCYHVLGQPQSQDVVVLADPQHPVSSRLKSHYVVQHSSTKHSCHLLMGHSQPLS